MKISLGQRIMPGPWGGGNQFARALADYLTAQGEEVSFDLSRPDLDLILLLDPRPGNRSAAYTDQEIAWHLLARNRRAVVVQRINESDAHRGSSHLNALFLRANRVADWTVFVSAWVEGVYRAAGFNSSAASVILNGSDARLFHPEGHRPWDGREPLRVITHHWSNNWNKGFDIYQRLDQLLDQEPFQGRLSFTFVGRLPEGLELRRATHLPPRSGAELAATLRDHHVYLTASRHEAGPNHQNEGALCGLPLLYLDQPSLVEYCAGFGVAFSPESFEAGLEKMIAEYHLWRPRMAAYPHTAARMGGAYHRLFRDLIDRREELLARRRPGRFLSALGRLARARALAQAKRAARAVLGRASSAEPSQRR